MPIIRATVKLAAASLLPEDIAQNVWHFENDGSPIDASDTGDIMSALVTFYSQTVPAFGIAPYLSTTRSRSTNVNVIELAEVTPGNAGEGDDIVSPVLARSNFTLAAATSGSKNLPDQVAVALSLEANLTGLAEELPGSPPRVRPRARRRGRLYLGPLNDSVLSTEATTNRPIITASVRSNLLNAYGQLMTTLAVGPEVRPVIYSRAGAARYEVDRVAVDDAFDIIRRRKIKRQVKDYLDVTQIALGA